MKKLFALVMVMALLFSLAGCDSSDYKKATALYEEGKYSEAAEMFTALGDYEDSAEMALTCRYELAGELFDDGSYEEAAAIYEDLGDYKSSERQLNACIYQQAEALFAAGSYEEAIEIYESLGNYEDCASKITLAKKELMLQQYGDVIDLLSKDAWFYADTAVNAVNVITFTADGASTKDIYYDGNGKHVTAETPCSYLLDDSAIYVTLPDGTELVIPYAVSGESVTLGAEGFFSIADVEAGLQGYWNSRETTYNPITGFSTSEYNIQLENGTITYEYAAEAYGYTDGTYYYYGPHTGTYTISANGFDTDAKNGFQFGFVITDGQLAMLRYDHICTPGSGLPGQDNYSF